MMVQLRMISCGPCGLASKACFDNAAARRDTAGRAPDDAMGAALAGAEQDAESDDVR